MKNSNKFLAFVVLAAYGLMFYFFISTLSYLLMLIIGLALGAGLLLADEYWLQKFYKEEEEADEWLVTRSPFFIIALIPLTIFVVTSINSHLGRGIVLGMYLYLLLEMAQYRDNLEIFKARYLQGANFKLTHQILNRALGFSFLFFILLNILAIL